MDSLRPTLFGDNPVKKCTGPCGRILPATTDYFHRHARKKDGLNSRCKSCKGRTDAAHRVRPEVQEHMREYNRRPERRATVRAGQEIYRQSTKGQAVIKAYRQKPEAKALAKAAAHYRRACANAASGTHTPQDIEAQFKRQKDKCYYCGVRLDKVKGPYHVDHVIPITRGGTNDISNLVITCPFCNISKGDRLLHEWGRGGRLC